MQLPDLPEEDQLNAFIDPKAWAAVIDAIAQTIGQRQQRELFERLKTIAENMTQPDQRYRQLFVDNPTLQKTVLRFDGGLECLYNLGFEHNVQSPNKLTCSKMDRRVVDACLTCLNDRIRTLSNKSLGDRGKGRNNINYGARKRDLNNNYTSHNDRKSTNIDSKTNNTNSNIRNNSHEKPSLLGVDDTEIKTQHRDDDCSDQSVPPSNNNDRSINYNYSHNNNLKHNVKDRSDIDHDDVLPDLPDVDLPDLPDAPDLPDIPDSPSNQLNAFIDSKAWNMVIDTMAKRIRPQQQLKMFEKLKKIAEKMTRDDARYRQLLLDSKTLQTTVLRFDGGLEFLYNLGFEQDPQSSNKLICLKMDKRVVNACVTCLNGKIQLLKESLPEKPAQQKTMEEKIDNGDVKIDDINDESKDQKQDKIQKVKQVTRNVLKQSGWVYKYSKSTITRQLQLVKKYAVFLIEPNIDKKSISKRLYIFKDDQTIDAQYASESITIKDESQIDRYFGKFNKENDNNHFNIDEFVFKCDNSTMRNEWIGCLLNVVYYDMTIKQDNMSLRIEYKKKINGKKYKILHIIANGETIVKIDITYETIGKISPFGDNGSSMFIVESNDNIRYVFVCHSIDKRNEWVTQLQGIRYYDLTKDKFCLKVKKMNKNGDYKQLLIMNSESNQIVEKIDIFDVYKNVVEYFGILSSFERVDIDDGDKFDNCHFIVNNEIVIKCKPAQEPWMVNIVNNSEKDESCSQWITQLITTDNQDSADKSKESEHKNNEKMCEKGVLCPMYVSIKESVEKNANKNANNFNFKQIDYWHVIEYNHYLNNDENKPSCPYDGLNCDSFKRFDNGKGKYALTDMDKIHLAIYKHVDDEKVNKLTRLHTDNRFNKLCVIKNSNDLKIGFNKPAWGGIHGLIQEVIKNGFTKDLFQLCLEDPAPSIYDIKNNKFNKILEMVNEKYDHIKHKEYGKPLRRVGLLALILYTCGDCNYDLARCHRNRNYDKWAIFDGYLRYAIEKLHHKEDKSILTNMKLYSGLKKVEMKTKLLENCYFPTFVSTTYDKEISMEFIKNDDKREGMLIEFAKDTVNQFVCCNVTWISKFPHECEILIARNDGIGAGGLNDERNRFDLRVVEYQNKDKDGHDQIVQIVKLEPRSHYLSKVE